MLFYYRHAGVRNKGTSILSHLQRELLHFGFPQPTNRWFGVRVRIWKVEIGHHPLVIVHYKIMITN